MFEKSIDAAAQKIAVAIVIGHNQQDIIVAMIDHALREGLHVYYVDNHSNDATRKIISDHFSSVGTVGYAMLPDTHRAKETSEDYSQLSAQMLYKQNLARTTLRDYQWVVHMDCNDFFVCPWAETVVEGLLAVSSDCGVVNCTVRDYYPSKKDVARWQLESNCAPMRDICQLLTVYRERKSGAYQRFLRNHNSLRFNSGNEATTTPRKLHFKKMILQHYPHRLQTLTRRKLSTPLCRSDTKTEQCDCVSYRCQNNNDQLCLPLNAMIVRENFKIINCSTAWLKHTTWYIHATVLKIPIFVISHNNLVLLKRCVASLKACFDRRYFEIVICDNNSTEESLIRFLQQSQSKVYWNNGNDLEKDVSKIVSEHFANNENLGRFYAVTDAAFAYDKNLTQPDTLLFYCHLLDNFASIDAVGPSSQREDIHNRHPQRRKYTPVQWQNETTVCAFGNLDTQFGLYRRSYQFKQPKTALLCHGRHSALRVDCNLDQSTMHGDAQLCMHQSPEGTVSLKRKRSQ